MEAYFLFRGGVPGASADAAAARCEEQDEDIGAPSDSEPSPSTSSGGSAAGSSSELDDDASSSGSPCSGGGGFGMSALMAQLPVKRGLSRFFDGRSQSFASLAAVGSLEDLAKPPRKRLKPSRSCGGGLDAAAAAAAAHRGGGHRLLSPRRHGAKPAAADANAARRLGARAGATLAVLGAVAAQRRPPLAAPAPRPEGVATGKALVVS